ncbi:MAG: hypothetical protein AB1476_05235 [Candidatus Hadarchaeota archaeon]
MRKCFPFFATSACLVFFMILAVPADASAIYPTKPLAISADGNYIAVSVWDSSKLQYQVYLFNPPKQELVWTINLNTPALFASVSSNGSRLAVGGGAGYAKVFEKFDNNPIRTYISDTRSISLSPDGNYLAYIADELFVYDISNDNLLRSYPISPSSMSPLSVSENGAYVLASTDQATYLFSKFDNNPIQQYLENHVYWVLSSLSPNGQHIAVATSAATRIFTREDNNPRLYLPWGRGVSISNSGVTIVGMDNISLFSLADGSFLRSYSVAGVAYVSVSSNGSRIAAATTDSDGNVTDVYLFDSSSTTPIWSYSFRPPRYQNPVIVASLIAVAAAVAIGLVFAKRRGGLKRITRRRR